MNYTLKRIKHRLNCRLAGEHTTPAMAILIGKKLKPITIPPFFKPRKKTLKIITKKLKLLISYQLYRQYVHNECTGVQVYVCW